MRSTRILKFLLLAAVMLGLTTPAIPRQQTKPAARKPNIVFIWTPPSSRLSRYHSAIVRLFKERRILRLKPAAACIATKRDTTRSTAIATAIHRRRAAGCGVGRFPGGPGQCQFASVRRFSLLVCVSLRLTDPSSIFQVTGGALPSRTRPA